MLKYILQFFHSQNHPLRNHAPNNEPLEILSKMSLQKQIETYYALQNMLNINIYKKKPHYKNRNDTTYSFHAFTAKHLLNLNRHSARVVDLGAEDAFLAHSLLTSLDNIKMDFTCIEKNSALTPYAHDNIRYIRADILDWILNDNGNYDICICGAVLSLFKVREQQQILRWVSKSCSKILIRECPLLTSMIDLYAHENNLPRTYNLFTEDKLKSLLNDSGFNISEISHEFDIYISASPITPKE